MSQNEKQKEWLASIYTKLITKMSAECDRVGSDIPFFPYEGKYRDCMMPDGISWWTNGFWPGMLWQMYNATKNEKYKTTAEAVESRLDEALQEFSKLHHDVGFMFMPSAVANYRKTGNEASFRRGMHAANILAGRFNPSGNFIRAWDKSLWAENVNGWMIIDSLLNLPLLYWASEESKNPSYAEIANRHATTGLHSIIREDGSCNHIAAFDPVSGEFIGGVSGQGYDKDSSWSRGQAWAVYGYALAYRYTNKPEYINAAKRCAHYCIANLAVNDWLPLVDFRAPEQPVKHDSGASAIIICGLLEISEHVPELEKQLYTDVALKMLEVIEDSFVNWNSNEDGILGGGSTMYHDDRMSNLSLIYGDYFFLEAILRFNNKSMMIW